MDFIGSVGLVDFFFVIFGRRFVGEKRCPNGLLPFPLYIRFPVAVDLGWASRDNIRKVRLQSLRTLCTVKGFPVVSSYVAWRADQVLYGSCTLDVDRDNVGSCVFAHDRALGGEARAKEYCRPF